MAVWLLGLLDYMCKNVCRLTPPAFLVAGLEKTRDVRTQPGGLLRLVDLPWFLQYIQGVDVYRTGVMGIKKELCTMQVCCVTTAIHSTGIFTSINK